MDTFLRSPYVKVLCCYLALSIAGLIPISEKAWASFLYHHSEKTSELDPESLEILQVALENELIVEKLTELGLTKEEVIRRIEQLSAEERQIILEGLQNIQAGGVPGILGLLLFPIFLFLFILDWIIGESEKTETARFRKNISWDFLPYKGEVKILVGEKPEFYWINVGDFYVRLKTSTSETREALSERLHEWIKAESAKYGTDTVILNSSSPRLLESGLLQWNGKAYRTRGY